MKTHFLLIILLFSLSAVMNSAQAEGAAGADAPPRPSTDGSLTKGNACLLNDQELSPFPRTFSQMIPHDAYDASSSLGQQLQQAKGAGCPADQLKVQRLYDIFSWQSFLAVNWPLSPMSPTGGVRLAQSLTEGKTPQWTTWMTAGEVFRADGSPPDAWNNRAPKAVRVLSDDRQAFSSTLWDQNGSPVYYESLMNEFEFDYILTNALYNQEGQTAFLATGQPVVFSPGSTITPERDGAMGPIELKLAWKVLGPNDIRERYFWMPAQIPGNTTGEEKKVEVGLVGMHISHKTGTSRQWVWSTFEHVDNVRVNALEVLDLATKGKTLKPSFYNLACPTCPVNDLPVPDSQQIKSTQVTRAISISDLTADLNGQVQRQLRNLGSAWQYYELVGTQYATQSVLNKPVPEYLGAESITNHSGGVPAPAYLANTVLETYFQKGNQESALFRSKEDVRVFQVASCMGCHFDAGLLKMADGKATNMPGTGDFSWLFSMARSRTSQTEVVVKQCMLTSGAPPEDPLPSTQSVSDK